MSFSKSVLQLSVSKYPFIEYADQNCDYGEQSAEAFHQHVADTTLITEKLDKMALGEKEAKG